MAALSPAGRWQALLARCLPSTLFGRLALLLFVAVGISHVLALTLMFELDPMRDRQPPPPGPRPSVSIAPAFPGDVAVMPPVAQRPPPPHERRWLHPGVLLDICVRLGALMLAAWWAARWLTQPIDRMASAARTLGADIHGPPLPEEGGTAETREACRVFNQMQARIQHQLQERDRFVAAVSHDLRTPLTRMRLRVETLLNEEDGERFIRDIAEMDSMITSTLDHLRGVAHGEPMALLDLESLLASLVDDEQACGHAVSLSGTAGPVPAQAGALRRCLANLIGNAVRYGGGAEVTLSDGGDAVHVAVRDHGPGVPEEELDLVLEPYYRVEASRNRDSGGAGLGLAIANDIMRRHGGRLELRNAPDGGLVATAVLPRPLS